MRKLSRIRFAFPWRIVLILALLLCLPSFGFWAWLRWEVPPLQRYYLIAYWHSSEYADQPGARTQIRWLMETAPGRKRQWLFALDVTKGSRSDLPFELSSFALGQGWTGIERTPVESMDAAELEKLLREDFYDGESFRRLVNEPLLYAVAAWLIVVYLAFMMRGDIGYEWRQLRSAVAEPQWSSNYGWDWPDNRGGIVAQIRTQIAPWIREHKTQLEWSAMGPKFGPKKSPDRAAIRVSDGPQLTQVQSDVSTARQLSPHPPAPNPQPPCQRRTIFPGSSSSDAARSPSEPWDESKWID